MKSLVLAEKPSVARDIARVLNCHKNLPGAIEGSQYVVTWALGHLVTLADPEEYDQKFIPNGTSASGQRCPNCGQETLVYQEGCLICTSCGTSKCG